MEKSVQLVLDRFGYFGVAVSYIKANETRVEVDVFIAINIGYNTTFSAVDCKRIKSYEGLRNRFFISRCKSPRFWSRRCYDDFWMFYHECQPPTKNYD